MKPVRPILRDNPNERVQALLRSAQLDVPPSDWKRRTLLALAPAACLPPTSEVTELAAGNGAGATATLAPKAVTAIAAKWAAIGAIAGGSLSATVTHAVDTWADTHSAVSVAAHQRDAADERRKPKPGTSSDTQRARAALPAPSVETSTDSAGSKPLTEPVASLPPADAPATHAGSHAVPRDRLSMAGSGTKQKPEPQRDDVFNDSPPRSLPVASLGNEVRSLHRIRQMSLERGAVVALDELDHHERQYPSPGLGVETAVLRIDLLWAAGQRSAAQTLAEHFLLAHPDCPHAEHVRALLSRKVAPKARSHPSTAEENAR